MKNFIFNMFAALVLVTGFAACSAEEGTMPGSDSAPSVRIYQYAPGEGYNKDNDVRLRFATNNKTTDVYYLMELLSEKTANVEKMGERGYMDYVVKNGQKVSGISGASNADLVLTGIMGLHAITAVAVNGNSMSMTEATFNGLKWDYLGEGMFYSAMFGDVPVEVYVLDDATKPTTYKLAEPFWEGLDLVITVDGNGNVAVSKQQVYVHPTYGDMYFEAAGAVVEENLLEMVGPYTVSAGSFGDQDEFLTLPGYGE